MWLTCSESCCDSKKPHIWVICHHQNVFLTNTACLIWAALCYHGSSATLQMRQLEYVFWAFYVLVLNGHTSRLTPVHWLQLVTWSHLMAEEWEDTGWAMQSPSNSLLALHFMILLRVLSYLYFNALNCPYQTYVNSSKTKLNTLKNSQPPIEVLAK